LSPLRAMMVEPWAKLVRDCACFVVGLWLLIHEELNVGMGKPLLISAALALCGVPAALRLRGALASKS